MARAIHPSWLAVLSDPVRIGLVHSLAERSAATAAELAVETHASERTVQRHLAALAAAGVVRELGGEGDGESPGRPAARFSLEEPARGSARELLAVLARPMQPSPRRNQ
jgi:predicted ArsR family transcriptional regulator